MAKIVTNDFNKMSTDNFHLFLPFYYNFEDYEQAKMKKKW